MVDIPPAGTRVSQKLYNEAMQYIIRLETALKNQIKQTFPGEHDPKVLARCFVIALERANKELP